MFIFDLQLEYTLYNIQLSVICS